jgi:hypothetical protein
MVARLAQHELESIAHGPRGRHGQLTCTLQPFD